MRPKRAGLNYFPLDTDFFNDDKIQLVEAEFGAKGSYVAIRLLCKIYANGWFYQWGGDECLLLSKQMGAGFVPNTVDEIVKGLVRRSFFDKGVFDTFQALTSAGIQRRYMSVVKQMGRNLAECVQRPEIWLVPTPEIGGNLFNSEINALNSGIKADNSGIMPIKEKKGKETKPNEGECHARTREAQFANFQKKLGQWNGPPLAMEFAGRLIGDEMQLTAVAQQCGMHSVSEVEDLLPKYMGWLYATQRRHTVYGDYVKTLINYIKIEQKEKSYGTGTKETGRSNATKRVCHRPEEYGEKI